MKIQKKEKTLEEIKAEHNKYSQKCKEYKSIRYTHESSRMKEEGMQYKWHKIGAVKQRGE